MQKKEIIILAILTLASIGIITLSMLQGRSEEGKALPPQDKNQPDFSPPLVHIVEEGETLSEISQQYYGTAQKWKMILEANDKILEKPEDMKPDMVLTIPRLK